MRRKRFPISYLIIFASLLLLMSLPKPAIEGIRGITIAILSPLWEQTIAIKAFAADNTSAAPVDNEEMQRLRIENTLLRNEINTLKEMMLREIKLVAQLASTSDDQDVRQASSFLTRRHRMELQKLLELQLQAVPGHVIFRSPASWNNSLWINVGESTNKSLGKVVVAKNSPVLVGTSIIGIIDYVGNSQSRVSLITDPSLSPSVRAVRNYDSEEPLYLAKGEISGSGKPLWRTQRHLLKGTGFNYDFADDKGPARDLRTGAPIDANGRAIPILQDGDLLVTTGMDGVYPPNLLVAEVTVVHALKEGDYYYELDALPTAGNLDDLSLVFVIPPVGFNPQERPPPPGWEH